ncbi:MAG: hypothetical protein E7018_01275 [Alphaproteobacteria bacterium]|nr:hypothetical protein [Alphaproteobacteria bacterium]
MFSGKFISHPKFSSLQKRIRLQDSRIWNRIRNAGCEWAAVRLCKGFSYLCWGASLPISSWAERVQKSYNPYADDTDENRIEYMSRCRQDYLQWVDTCRQHNINSGAAIDILYFGRNTKDIEKIYCRRHGWAISNLMQALDLYRK